MTQCNHLIAISVAHGSELEEMRLPESVLQLVQLLPRLR